MSTTTLVVFQGVDSTSGPVVINMDGLVSTSNKVLSVVTLSPVFDVNDWVSAFSLTTLPGIAVQAGGHNFAGRTFLALVQVG